MITEKKLYIYKGSGDIELIRTVEKNASGSWKTERYSFTDRAWLEHRPVSASALKEYYRELPHDESRLLENTERLSQGLPLLMPDARCDRLLAESEAFSADTSQMLPVAQTLDPVTKLRNETESLTGYMETVQSLAMARLQEQMAALRSDSHPLNMAIRRMSVQADVLRKTCDLLKMYLGEAVSVTDAGTGECAPASEPVTIRQRILFMDEEMAVLGDDGKGLDAGDISTFAEWLKTPEHRDIIVPEPKCVVTMKPRRFKKRYTSDWRENDRLNEWNFHSFLVIRNGGNVRIIESGDLCIHDSAIPRMDSIKEIMDCRWKSDYNKEDAVRNLQYRALLLAQAVQGIADRTGFFSPADIPLSIKDSQGVAYVYDDERDSMIGTGIVPFREWIEEKSRSIRRGSRILYVPALAGGQHSKFYGHQFSKPTPPEAGVYSVDTEEAGGKVTFLYHPIHQYRGDRRERQERWKVSGYGLINYDEMTPEEIDTYLKDRTQREHYESLIPLLVKLRQEKAAEQENERLFRDCIRRDPALPSVPSDALLDEAIAWWKKKVIFIRPLSADDKKSYRMILNYLKTHTIK